MRALELTDPAWHELVAEAAGATAFHLPAWGRVLAETYGYQSIVLADQDGAGCVRAGAILARVRRVAGPVWVSLPFSDHCPPLARDRGSLHRLAADLADWSGRQGVPVEVRAGLPATPGWRESVIGVRHVLSLVGDEESLRTGLSQTHRRRLRQGERGGLEVRLGRSADDVSDFYRLHLATRRRQGVPVQPRRFFDALWRHMIAPGHGMVALVGPSAGQPAAAAVVFASHDTAIGKFHASDDDAWELRPNHLLYWAVIRWAIQAGYRHFDFGRSETHHSGLQQWKAGWGAEATPLAYARAGGGGAWGAGRGGIVGGALGHVIRRSPALVCRALGALLYRYAA